MPLLYISRPTSEAGAHRHAGPSYPAGGSISSHRAATSWQDDVMDFRRRSNAFGARTISPPNGSNDIHSLGSGSNCEEDSSSPQWINAATCFFRSSMFFLASSVLAMMRTHPPANPSPVGVSSKIGASIRTLIRTPDIVKATSRGPSLNRQRRSVDCSYVLMNSLIAAWQRCASSRLYPCSRRSFASRRASTSSK